MTATGLEELLIAQAAKGDQRAFERLYRTHVGRVHGLYMRMTQQPPEWRAG